MSYPAPPPASPPPSSSAGATPSPGGFFNDLFDIRFTRFVSLRLISVVYVLILVLVSIVALAVIFSGFATGVTYGIFSLILAVLGWIIYIVLARVALEAFAVLFRIHDDTSRVADALAGSRGTAAGYDVGGSGSGSVAGYGTSRPYAGQGYGAPSPGAPAAGTSGPGTPSGGTPGGPQGDPSGPPWS
jgi:hypothetical protein